MGFWNRTKQMLGISNALENTKKKFTEAIETVVIGYAKIDDDFLDDLEVAMITADLGSKTTELLMKEIRRGVTEGKINHTNEVMGYIEEYVTKILEDQEETLEMHSPEVILVVGVNGVGKTTTIAKLAHYYKEAGKKVVLAAADTFRAAASEQLSIWAERADVPIVKHQEGADPAAVVYDALASAKARNADIVIIDTAGRLHTKTNLMEELKKIGRVADRQVPGAPHQTLLILDGTTGQNAVSQAKLFGQAVPITGIIVTKLDGTAKGGVVISIKEELGVPVRWIGIGEKIDDLQPFNAKEFANALFDKGMSKHEK
ncbi:signal recognition particle-docking protein FtsY [Veillonella criceti]|uniref:Signal recognition particle receptor FtsY n=1 Tax=Veillonella criceti TaxID=103891 RepID=A0A380NGJ0_9FIRM|nr:signal recognition particle-docking protein FtsY [Veillonella criceti]SUP39760.1 Cell division protein FtsY homolog [Veillonella criceti]